MLSTVQNAGYFGIMTWLPKYLNSELGLSLTSTGMWTAVTVIGMMIGISVFGWLADKAGRRPAFWIFQVGAAASVLVYSQLHDPTALLEAKVQAGDLGAKTGRGFYEWTGETGQAVICQRDENLIRQLVEDVCEEA